MFIPPTTLLPIAGMEELTLEQINKKSELEENIDFENGGPLLSSVGIIWHLLQIDCLWFLGYLSCFFQMLICIRTVQLRKVRVLLQRLRLNDLV